MANSDISLGKSVIVATGLVALVDTCIQERSWKTTFHLENPSLDVQPSVESYISLPCKEQDQTTISSFSTANVDDDRLEYLSEVGKWIACQPVALSTDTKGQAEGHQGLLPMDASVSILSTTRSRYGDEEDSGVSQTRSQTLNIYPALASYALNRVFVHARAGYVLEADPKGFLERLVLQDCWYRWVALQEGVTDLKDLRSFLTSQNLDGWTTQCISLEGS
jgi:hypothetical protein